MRIAAIVLSFLLWSGCRTAPSEADLLGLNGYWEIAEVTLSDGSTKDYTMNTSIDYIETDGREGFRKKVQPQVDGTYITSDDAISFVIVRENGRFRFQYRNDGTEWTEELKEISQNSFSVTNESGIRYRYERFEPFDL